MCYIYKRKEEKKHLSAIIPRCKVKNRKINKTYKHKTYNMPYYLT